MDYHRAVAIPKRLSGAGTIEHTLFNLVIRDLREGQLAAISLDRMITLGTPPRRQGTNRKRNRQNLDQ